MDDRRALIRAARRTLIARYRRFVRMALITEIIRQLQGRTPRIWLSTTIASERLVDSVLNHNDIAFQHLFRLRKETFRRLVEWLKVNTNLQNTCHILAEHQVLIFLLILAHNNPQRSVAISMCVSQPTVSRVFAYILPMFISLHIAFVCLPDEDWLDPKIELKNYTKYFNGCIGAIDGTHIPAFVPIKQQRRYRDRKGNLSQNVFAAVRFDMSISYILAGAEGSMNDAALYRQTMGRDFSIPNHRYYVADAGFASSTGVVVPYPNVVYHLQDWRNEGRPPSTAMELYNYRHAQIRCVVERVFGTIKRKWKIIRCSAPEMTFATQKKVVYAVTGLHNFILAQEREVISYAEDSTEILERAARRAEIVVGADSQETRRLASLFMWRAHTAEDGAS